LASNPFLPFSFFCLFSFPFPALLLSNISLSFLLLHSFGFPFLPSFEYYSTDSQTSKSHMAAMLEYFNVDVKTKCGMGWRQNFVHGDTYITASKTLKNYISFRKRLKFLYFTEYLYSSLCVKLKFCDTIFVNLRHKINRVQ
jgi:hypothetical protein